MEVQDISIKTQDKLQPLETKEEEKYEYNESEQEKKDIAYVMDRLDKMKGKRSLVDENWQKYQTNFESSYIEYIDGRHRSNVSIENSIIQLSVSEINQKNAILQIKNKTREKGNLDLLREIKDIDWKENNRDVELMKDNYICAIFGTSVMQVGFEQKNRIIKDIDFTSEKMEYKPKLQKKGVITLKSVDIRDFYIDDRVTDFEDATDCIYTYTAPYDTFINLKYAKGYKNIEKVESIQDDKDKIFINKEEYRPNNIVKITCYYNKEKDREIMIANDKWIIRDTPLRNPRKILPFTVRRYLYNPLSVYGRGVGELLLSTKTDINTLKETLMEAIKRSNNEVLALGGGVNFDGKKFAYNNTVLKFTGNLRNNFQQLQGTPPNQAIFSYLQMLYDEAGYWTGVDLRALGGVQEKTAYQTAVRQEIMAKMINNAILQRNLAYKRMYELYIDMLQTFYPRKVIRKLIPLKQTNKGLKLGEVQAEYPEIKLEGKAMVNNKLVEKEGEEYIRVKPEMIRGDLAIDVETNFNQPTLKQVKIESMNQFMNTMVNMEQIAQSSEVVQENKEKLIKESIKLYDVPLEIDEGKDEGIKEDKEKLMSTIGQLQQTFGAGVPEGLLQSK